MMDHIFFINDDCAAAQNAASFVQNLALINQSKLTIGLAQVKKNVMRKAVAAVAAGNLYSLTEPVKYVPERKPAIEYPAVKTDISSLNAQETARIIAASGATAAVKGFAFADAVTSPALQALSNHITEPLWLIPANCKTSVPLSLAYITDLRYCRTDILNHILRMTECNGARVSVVHLAAPGLPDLSAEFAEALFQEICLKVPCSNRLSMHHVKKAELTAVADVLINGLQVDALVAANRSPHFGDLDRAITQLTIPGASVRPMLLFPG